MPYNCSAYVPFYGGAPVPKTILLPADLSDCFQLHPDALKLRIHTLSHTVRRRNTGFFVLEPHPAGVSGSHRHTG